MALITISGYPCADVAGSHLSVSILSDDTLNTPRSAYDNSASEKPARAALFSALQRQLGNDRIVIVDALNYIKGFRYQMYCAAREAKVRVCTVYVIAPPEQCRAWNAQRDVSHSYTSKTLDDLIQRFEEPSSMVRWDAPLFTVPWTDVDVPGDDIWRAITLGVVKPPNTGTQAIAKAPTSALLELERTTTAIVSAVLTAQSGAPGPGGRLALALDNTGTHITLPPRLVTLSELQRHKRQFVAIHKRAITLGSTEMGPVDWGQESVVARFVAYLEEHVA